MRRICIFLVVFIGCMCVVQSCLLPIYDAYVEVYVENNAEVHLDTLSFFFISADTLRRYGYDYVAEHNILLMRYDLSISDMESLGFRIPYPPKEEMNSMKIRKH